MSKKYTPAEFSAALQNMSNEVKRRTMKRAATAGALVIEGAAKISMSATAHTGARYGRHQASAPGETPAVDTGTLVNSISTWVDSQSDERIVMGVGTGILYAKFLEFGTRHMEARPFMRPAVDNNVDKINQAISIVFARDVENMI